ncbi:hypothetical protein ACFCW4_06980 [Streptomyces virginiae]
MGRAPAEHTTPEKEVAGQPALLRVGADGPKEYVVIVESALDGSTIGC